MIDVIVLAGGFAKRMWPLTKDRPKHLLKVGGKTMLSYTLDPLLEMNEIENIYISTNTAFGDQFADFIDERYGNDRVKLIVEPTLSEGEKLGSVGGLGYLIRKEGLNRDTVIIGGDNLFEFHVREAVEVFRRVGRDIVAVFDVKDIEKASLYGIVDVSDEGIITNFLEKPEDPPSTLAATAFYIFTEDTVKLIISYLDGGGKKDALGHFITYLVENKPVYAWSFRGIWFDIGSVDSYREADEYFTGKGSGDIK
ncbi:MAG: nucleotidyltransferase family protein [Thermoplasmatota archaeon]